MSTMPRPYPKEFRADVVAVARRGDAPISQIASDMQTLTVAPAVLTGYHQYQNSDCLNGAVLRVEDGYCFVEKLPSHHAILATGDLVRRLEVMSSVLGLDVLTI